MARLVDPAIEAELTADTIYPILIVRLDTSAGEVRVWSGVGDLTFNAQIYSGIGDFGGISPITEAGDEVRADAIALQLSGIPSTHINTALTTDYRGRSIEIWLAFLQDGLSVSTALLLFRGRLDAMVIDEGPTVSTVTISAESRLADLDRPRIRRYTDQDQKELFPNDRGLEYVAGIQNADVVWQS